MTVGVHCPLTVCTGVLMILATAVEFSPGSQAGVKNRPSDDIYLNQLVKQLEHTIKVDTREQPFCQTYVAKARLLIHAYFERIQLQDPGLRQGTVHLMCMLFTCVHVL